MKKAKIFRKWWRFLVETSLVKESKNYWYYDIKCSYLEWGNGFPAVISYEGLQNERPVDGRGWIKIKKTSNNEDTDRKQIYNHFINRFKEQEIKFIRF